MAPELPTLVEAGYPTLVAENFFGVSAPAGVPRNVIDTINKAVQGALDDARLQSNFAELGITTAKMSADDFTAFVRKQVTDWAPAVKASGAKLN